MRRFGIVLFIINALAVIILGCLSLYTALDDRVRFGSSAGYYIPRLIPVLPLILSLIYIWRTMGDDKKLAALKVEKEKLETIKSIKELRKELGEE